MITNETRAKLIHPEWWDGIPDTEAHYFRPSRPYDTDANAVAELRAFVRARGKEAEFTNALADAVEGGRFPYTDVFNVADAFILLDATPAQQCAAFDTVFADDLEKL